MGEFGLTPPSFAPKDSNRSILSQYPAGRIIWQDSFSLGDFSNAGWVSGVAAETQTGGITERSFNHSLSGSRAALHVNNPVDSSIQTGARPFSVRNYEILSKVGVEFWWSYNNAMKTAANFPNYDFFVQWWDGASRFNGGMLWAPNAPQNMAVTTAGGGVTFATFNLPAYDDSTALYGTENWNNHKLIVNIKTSQFVSCDTPRGFFDLSASKFNPVLKTADTTVPKGMFRVGVACNTDVSTPAGGMDAYMGMIIVTDES